MATDWDADRFDAYAIIRNLCTDFEETEESQQGLLKRWPERPSQNSSSSTADCIPELYLRQAENDHCSVLRNLIERSVSALVRGTDDEKEVDSEQCQCSLKTLHSVRNLSDRGLAEAAPLLLPNLQRKALMSLFFLVVDDQAEVAIRNRAYLLKKVELGLHSFEAQLASRRTKNRSKSTHQVLEILRSPDSYKIEAEFSGRISLLGSLRSPRSAAISALMNLDSLPLTSLHIMLEMLYEKPPEPVIGKLPVGANKARLTNSIIGLATSILSDMKDDNALPERLRSALVVMSLSARLATGDDGKLIDHLSPSHWKIQDRQQQLLFCLSKLNLLTKEQLSNLIQDLMKSRLILVHSRRPDQLRKILVDCLLRSEVRRVPKVVRRALRKIKEMVSPEPKVEENSQLKLVKKVDVSELDTVRLGVELEATLRVSAHLQQMVRDALPETTDWCEAEDGMQAMEGSELAIVQQGSSEGSMERRLTNACDITAGIGYTLVGCAIEGMVRYTRTKLKYSVTEYLRSGTGTGTCSKRKASESFDHEQGAQDQVTTILNAAQSFLGTSVMRRVKIRLGRM